MTFVKKKSALIQYLKLKTLENDWHAVSDVANDLRVLEAYQTKTARLMSRTKKSDK